MVGRQKERKMTGDLPLPVINDLLMRTTCESLEVHQPFDPAERGAVADGILQLQVQFSFDDLAASGGIHHPAGLCLAAVEMQLVGAAGLGKIHRQILRAADELESRILTANLQQVFFKEV